MHLPISKSYVPLKFSKLFCSFSLITSLLLACGPANERSAKSTQAYPAYFLEVLEAHGGLDQWNQMGTLQYRLRKDGTASIPNSIVVVLALIVLKFYP